MTTETISSDAAEGAELLATAQQALEDLKAVDPVVLLSLIHISEPTRPS